MKHISQVSQLPGWNLKLGLLENTLLFMAHT